MPLVSAESPFWKSWCGQSLAVWVDGAVEHEADHGQGDHGLRYLWQVLVVPGQPAPASEPAECALNGLIANDKFCLTRTVRLRLSWPRARGRLRADRPQPPGEVTPQGGEHRTAAAQLACSADGRASGKGSAALGPGLSASPAVGGAAATRAGRGAGTPDLAGGTPCT